jgi:hypothetical protein
MDPVFIVIPGLLGGVVIAVAIALLRHRFHARLSKAAGGREPVAAINISSIRVAGIGGLGLVAMAVAVAWNFPRIGLTMELGLFLGALMAIALIVARRRFGSMPSSGQHGGANTILAIDEREPTRESDSERTDLTRHSSHQLA